MQLNNARGNDKYTNSRLASKLLNGLESNNNFLNPLVRFDSYDDDDDDDDDDKGPGVSTHMKSVNSTQGNDKQ